MQCPKCGSVWPGRSDTCLHCGHTRVRANDVSALPGELVELKTGKKDKYTSEYKENWYHAMIGLLRQRGKNENRAYHLYREKFGVDPAWKKEAGAITEDVVGYLQRANIAFAKSAKKAA